MQLDLTISPNLSFWMYSKVVTENGKVGEHVFMLAVCYRVWYHVRKINGGLTL